MQQCLIYPNNVTSRKTLSLMLSISQCRPYATRANPAKKPPSKIAEKSASAPTKSKIKTKTKPVSKSAATDVLEQVKSHNGKSMFAIGTSFELRSLKLLQDKFSMALDRVAGPGDGGVDLVGWWWLPRLPGLPEIPSTITPNTSNGDEAPQMRSRIRVLAQCKAEKNKMGPNYVREMEGVLHRVLNSQSSPSPLPVSSESSDGIEKEDGPAVVDQSSLKPLPTVAMIVSQSRFTNGALARAMSSPIPFILLYLPPESDEVHAVEDSKASEGDKNAPSLQWNPALGSAGGLLGGRLEVRWQREAGRSQPTVWWEGRPMESYVPP